MKRICLIALIATALPTGLTAQGEWDFGPVLGIGYYQGDINQDRYFYKPGPVGGLMARQAINPRYALRGNLLFGQIAANDYDFKQPYQQARGYSFRSNYLEASVLVEFNFISFNTPRKNDFDHITTFVSTGLSYLYAFDLDQPSYPGIPMIIGGKARLLEDFILTIEYSYRKLFSDQLDNIDFQELRGQDLLAGEDPAQIRQLNDNQHNDWYALLTISLAFKVDFYSKDCKIGYEYD